MSWTHCVTLVVTMITVVTVVTLVVTMFTMFTVSWTIMAIVVVITMSWTMMITMITTFSFVITHRHHISCGISCTFTSIHSTTDSIGTHIGGISKSTSESIGTIPKHAHWTITIAPM